MANDKEQLRVVLISQVCLKRHWLKHLVHVIRLSSQHVYLIIVSSPEKFAHN
jgi:hypothetical protein